MKDKKNQEMSQGDILDSIRKMVETDQNTSVIELTNLINDDGSVSKVSKDKISQKKSQKETDVGDFLRLMRDNESMSAVVDADRREVFEDSKMNDDRDLDDGRMMMTGDYIHRIVQKTVKDYLDANLPAIAKKIIEHEVVSMLRKM